ncbi:hypothetical protein CERZMDRAFT_94162 [Cercospora zeae-maydis SCOH1-5]|uniref:Uncharacterized protein n=1 Tax=Cercospora zeae-maydis SCOH1-5 TaxID=717836 RepID=A0A6A6FQW3_9PEZI|nr:hypothetical protein CERZMDRAFT_94162 [Cercospora zeae-maydis SCOH1-5]
MKPNDMRGSRPRRSPSVESLTDKFKTWNASLSGIQIRGTLAHKAGLRAVQEAQAMPFSRADYTKSTPTIYERAKDSAVDLGELRDRWGSAENIFTEHEQNIRRRAKSRDPSRSRVCITRISEQSDVDGDGQFLERIERMRSARKPRSTAATIPTEKRPILERAAKSTPWPPHMQTKMEKSLPPLPEEGGTVSKRTFIHSIKSSRHLRNMRSLSSLKTYVNPHESMDFRCVGSPTEAISAFEDLELQSERDDLLQSINLTRIRMGVRAIQNLERSPYLDREAQEAADDLDKYESVPAGSTATMDDETATAQLIGPAGYPGMATGERWASFQNKAQRQTQCTCKGGPHTAKSAACPCRSYNVFAAITDESWKVVGMARTTVDRRWVVLLSAWPYDNDDSRSTRTLVTPANSVRKPRAKSKQRRSHGPPPIPSLHEAMTPLLVQDEDETPATPATPPLPF